MNNSFSATCFERCSQTSLLPHFLFATEFSKFHFDVIFKIAADDESNEDYATEDSASTQNHHEEDAAENSLGDGSQPILTGIFILRLLDF